MHSMGRLGSYISRGVYTVSGSFHPFGGAVDIIVVEQPDGSFRSSPWYVRFGKFQGVLRTKERIVSVRVNGAEADFHMYLDYSGRTYFLKEIEEEVEEAATSPSVVKENKGRMQDKSRRFASKSWDFDAIGSNYNDSDGEKPEGRRPRRSRTFDRIFGRKLARRKEDGRGFERLNSLERAQIVAELLDVNWSAGLPTKKGKRIPGSQLSASNDMENSAVSSNHEAGVSNQPVENGESRENVRRKIACSTDSKEQVEMHCKSFNGSDNDEKKMEILADGISKDFARTDRLQSFSYQDKPKSSAAGSRISRVHFYSTPLESQKLKKQKKDADEKPISHFTRDCNKAGNGNSVIELKSSNKTVGVDLTSGCIPVKGAESNPLCRKCGLSGMCSTANDGENEGDDESTRQLRQTSESTNNTRRSCRDGMRIATQISSLQRSMDREYSEHCGSKLDEATQMYPISKDCVTKCRCFFFPATYSREALQLLLVDNKSCINSDDSSTDDLSTDAQTSNTNLREIAIPIAISGSHSVDIGKNVRRVQSMPNMRSHYDYLNKLILHKPLSRSLDSNSKFLNLSLVHGEDLNPVKFDSGKEPHLLQKQVDVDCAESFKGKISIFGNPTSERVPFGSISCEGTGDHATCQTTQEGCLVDDNSPKQKMMKRFIRALTPTSEQLASLNLMEGSNTVTFTLSSSILGLQQVEARIYLWKWNHRIVISDVDGTITRSDVLGQFMPLVGVDWSQTGVARLFSAIKENGYQLLFLSARALCQAYLTRRFLFNLKQDGNVLPDGPVVISPDGLFPSLYREVIRRVPHEFKIACLEAIKELFPSDCNPFYAGFGNRDTDEFSYLKVGIPKGKIFIINPKGEVAVNRNVNTKSYTSLHDLVNGMFPVMASLEQEDYNSWNFWKLPPPTIDF